MSDFAARAVASIRGRHAAKIRELAEDIRQNADYILADLDRGRVPRIRNVLDDAQQLNWRIEALTAVNEVADIYATGEKSGA